MYQDPIIAAYTTLIKASAGGVIKEFYQGDPSRVPVSNFPCAILSKRATRVQPITNAEDQHSIGISLTLIIDKRNDLNTESGMQSAVAGVGALYDVMEGREADYTLKDTSILGILRQNIDVDTANNLRTDLGSITAVEYGSVLRNQSEWTIESRVDFVAHFVQNRV